MTLVTSSAFERLHSAEVTLLFSDIEKSTELTEYLGDAEAYWLIERHLRLVRTWVARFHGEEVEIRGDGALLAFATPDDGLACAIGIQRAVQAHAARTPEARVRVRMGLHTGSVIRVERGYFGSEVIRSARIAGRAHPGEILVSTQLRQRLLRHRHARFGRGRQLKLKGFQGRQLVFDFPWKPGSPARWNLEVAEMAQSGRVPEFRASGSSAPRVCQTTARSHSAPN